MQLVVTDFNRTTFIYKQLNERFQLDEKYKDVSTNDLKKDVLDMLYELRDRYADYERYDVARHLSKTIDLLHQTYIPTEES